MSRTYKTDPTWVKLRKPSKAREEFHNHIDGTCKFDDWFNSTTAFYPYNARKCGYTVSYYGYHGGFYARPRRVRSYREEHEGRLRSSWRMTERELLKLDKQAVEDYDGVVAYNHRHSALWELY